MLRLMTLFALLLAMAAPVTAQEATDTSRAATGGAQTLDDILRRQESLAVDDSFRSDVTGNPDAAAPITDQLGTLGGASDPDGCGAPTAIAVRMFSTQSRGPAVTTMIQDRGMWWLEFREGPLVQMVAYLLGGTLLALALFYLIRGRIRIDGEKTGRTITRFKAFERFGHWLLASSFLLLGSDGSGLALGAQSSDPRLWA